MKKTISLEKHKEIGMMCKILHDLLVTKECKIYRESKSKSQGAKVSYHYKRAYVNLDRFRNSMEFILFKEFPELGESGVDIYWGPRPKDFEESQTAIPSLA